MRNLSDKELYVECKKWGSAALKARWRFEGLLSEVNRRRLYEKKGFDTIYDFARILAGVSRNQVNRVLQLDRKFEDKPALREVLIEGKVSVNKLARVASIATEENQIELLEKVQKLSKAAVDVYVKERRNIEPDGLFKTDEPVPGHSIDEPNYDFEIINAMSPELKKSLKELIDQGHNVNKILLGLLAERARKIEEEMEEVSCEVRREEEEEPKNGRYVKVKIKRILREKYGSKCGQKGCENLAVNIHHEKLFAKNHTNDPRWLRPLCKSHHEIVHQYDWQVQKFRQMAIGR